MISLALILGIWIVIFVGKMLQSMLAFTLWILGVFLAIFMLNVAFGFV